MFSMEDKENDGKSQDERSNNKLSGNSAYPKVRRSVLKEFDPLAPVSPLTSKPSQIPVVEDDEVFEDAQTHLPNFSDELTPTRTPCSVRESLLIPELKEYRLGCLQSLNDTGDLSFAECVENLSQFNVNSSEDDVEFNYKIKNDETLAESLPEEAEMDKTFEASSATNQKNIDAETIEHVKQSRTFCHDDIRQNERFDLIQVQQFNSINPIQFELDNQDSAAEKTCDLVAESPDNSFSSQKSLGTMNNDEHQIIFVDIQLNKTHVDSSMVNQSINSNDADPLNIDASISYSDQNISVSDFVVNDSDLELENDSQKSVMESDAKTSELSQNSEQPSKDEDVDQTLVKIELGLDNTFEASKKNDQLLGTKDEGILQTQVNIESVIEIVGEPSKELSVNQNSTDIVMAPEIEASAEINLSVLESGCKVNNITSSIEGVRKTVLDNVDEIIPQALENNEDLDVIEIDVDPNKAESLSEIQNTTATAEFCGNNDDIGSEKSVHGSVALKIKVDMDPQVELSNTIDANAENYSPVLKKCYNDQAERLPVIQNCTVKETTCEKDEQQTIIASEASNIPSEINSEPGLDRTFESGAKYHISTLEGSCDKKHAASKTEEHYTEGESVFECKAKIEPGGASTENVNPECDIKGEVVEIRVCNNHSVDTEAVSDESENTPDVLSKTFDANAEEQLPKQQDTEQLQTQGKTSSDQVQLDKAFLDQNVPESPIPNETDDQKKAAILLEDRREDHSTAVDLVEHSDLIHGNVDATSKKVPEILVQFIQSEEHLILEEAQFENRAVEGESEDQKIINFSIMPKEGSAESSNLNNELSEGSVELQNIVMVQTEHIETDRINLKDPLVTIASPLILDTTDFDKAVEALARSLNQTIDVEESAIVDDIDLTDTSDDKFNVTIEVKSNTRHEAIIDTVENEIVEHTCDVKQEPNADITMGKEPAVETSTASAQLTEKIENIEENTKIPSAELTAKLESVDCGESQIPKPTNDVNQKLNADIIIDKEPVVETITKLVQGETNTSSVELAVKVESVVCKEDHIAEPTCDVHEKLNEDIIMEKERILKTSTGLVEEKAKTGPEELAAELESVESEESNVIKEPQEQEYHIETIRVNEEKDLSDKKMSGSQRLECRPNIRPLRNKTQVITNPLLVKGTDDLNEELLKEYKLRRDQLKQQADQLQDELEKLVAENVQKDQCILSHALSRESDRNRIANYKMLIQDYQKHITKQCEELCLLKSQSEEFARQFTSTEMAFSQVFERYEKAKRVIEAYRKNEEILTQNIKNAENQLAQLEVKCKAIQDRLNRDVKKAQEQLDQEKGSYKSSIAKLKAMVKRLEIKAASLETAVKQKTEECQALASLCDDITGRQPT